MKAESTVRKEAKRIHELWKEAEVGSARGWFVLGALWALVWVLGSHTLASRFAKGSWECDENKFKGYKS